MKRAKHVFFTWPRFAKLSVRSKHPHSSLLRQATNFRFESCLDRRRRWTCSPPGDFEDDFETNAVADEDIAAMAVEECQLTTLTSSRLVAQGPVLERRREVLVFLRQNGGQTS